jgi:choline-glycine betaine transporter
MTPKKPDWFELTENSDSYAGIQKMNKKLPIATLVAAGAIILGGSIFATANNEPSAVAQTPTTSQSIAAAQPSASMSTPANNSSAMNSLPVPTLTTTPQRGDDD